MRYYKLVLLFKSGLKKEEKDHILGDIKKWIGESFKNEKVQEMGEKKLAYVINKEKKGEYVLYEFEADTLPQDLDKKMIMNNDILRHLIVRIK